MTTLRLMILAALVVMGTSEFADARGRGSRSSTKRSSKGRAPTSSQHKYSRTPSYSAPHKSKYSRQTPTRTRPSTKPGSFVRPSRPTYTRPRPPVTRRPTTRPPTTKRPVTRPPTKRPVTRPPNRRPVTRPPTRRPSTTPTRRPGRTRAPVRVPSTTYRPPTRQPIARQPVTRNQIGARVTRRDAGRSSHRSQRTRRLQNQLNLNVNVNNINNSRNITNINRTNVFRNSHNHNHWRSDYYSHHSNWYRGTWNRGWNGRWGTSWSRYMLRRYPVLMRFNTSLWGINRVAYWWGYRRYRNCYYVGDLRVVNYSQPITAAPPYEQPAASGLAAFERAKYEFANRNYGAARLYVDAALKELPRDVHVNEFRALVLFAQADYKHAAEALFAVLSVGPGWNWTTMSGLYGTTADYTRQLRTLETYVRANPRFAPGHFVLGYHYLTCGYSDQAGDQFQAALKLNPDDDVSRQTLVMLGITPPPKIAPPPSDDDRVTIPVEAIVGTWTAKRGDANFRLTLTKDNNFTWSYVEGKRRTVAYGVYAMKGSTLVMEPDAGGVMVAGLKLKGRNTLRFRMQGDDNDTGLSFRR